MLMTVSFKLGNRTVPVSSSVPGAVSLTPELRRSLQANWLVALKRDQWWLMQNGRQPLGPFSTQQLHHQAQQASHNKPTLYLEPEETLASRGGSIGKNNSRWQLLGEGGVSLEFDTPIILGRDLQADLRCVDPQVSNAHVLLWPQTHCVALFDLSSRNGTLAPTGESLTSCHLKSGQAFRVGKRLFRVENREHADNGISLLRPEGPMAEVDRNITLSAGADAPVVIHGESGVGKESVARAIHERSGSPGEFVAVNCASFSEHLSTSELFGHKKGAFTGATADRDGYFIRAHGGTLFLDEVAELSLGVQAELLRVIETGEVRPVGSTQTEYATPRIVAATHRDLSERVRAGRFREDLFFRLSVLQIDVPPLRTRPQDIALLAEHFAELYSPGHKLSTEVHVWLKEQPWPGNIRELRNLLRRSAAYYPHDPFHLRNLQSQHNKGNVTPIKPGPAETMRVYRQLGESVQMTAEVLGIHRSTVHRHISAMTRAA